MSGDRVAGEKSPQRELEYGCEFLMNFTYGDLKTIVGEDKGSVGSG